MKTYNARYEIKRAVVDLSTGESTTAYPDGFSQANTLIIGYFGLNTYGAFYSNIPQITVYGQDDGIHVIGEGNFSGMGAQAHVFLLNMDSI